MFELVNFLKLSEIREARCLAVSNDAKWIFVGSRKGECVCIDSTTFETKFHATIDESIISIAYNSKCSQILAGSDKGNIFKIDIDGKVISKDKYHSSTISSIKILHENDDEFVVTTSWDSSCRITKNSQILHKLEGNENAVWDAVYIPSTDKSITCGADKTVRIYQGSTEIKKLTFHSDVVRSVCFVASDRFATAGNDSKICLYKLDGTLLHQTIAHAHFIFSLDSHQNSLISCGEDSEIKIWQIDHWQLKQTIPIHYQTIWQVAVRNNGHTIIAITADNHVLAFSDDQKPFNHDIQNQYAKLLAESQHNPDAINVNEEDMKNLPGMSALNTKGITDGETKLIRKGKSTIHVFKWSKIKDEWNEVGKLKIPEEGFDAAKQLDGKRYDYIFDIELENGLKRKIGYNKGQNPYQVSQEFIDKHMLSQNYIEQIAEFLKTNTDYRKANADFKYFPRTSLIKHNEGNLPKVVSKMREFSPEFFSDENVASLTLTDEISTKFFEHIDSLDENKKFPFIDYLKYKVIGYDDQEGTVSIKCAANANSIMSTIKNEFETCQANPNQKSMYINLALYFKILSNLITFNAKNFDWPLHLELLWACDPETTVADPRCMLSYHTLMYNIIVLMHLKYREELSEMVGQFSNFLHRSITKSVFKSSTADNFILLLLSYGTLMFKRENIDLEIRKQMQEVVKFLNEGNVYKMIEENNEKIDTSQMQTLNELTQEFENLL